MHVVSFAAATVAVSVAVGAVLFAALGFIMRMEALFIAKIGKVHDRVVEVTGSRPMVVSRSMHESVVPWTAIIIIVVVVIIIITIIIIIIIIIAA